MQEWDSIKMVGCPHCGGLMVEGGTCRVCAGRASRGGAGDGRDAPV